MPHFTKRLKTGFGHPEFFFNRIFSVAAVRYHVSVHDENRKVYFFNMDVKAGEWYISSSPKLPEWIMNLQSELSDAIVEHRPFELSE